MSERLVMPTPPWMGAGGLFRPRVRPDPDGPPLVRRLAAALRVAPVSRARRAMRTGAGEGVTGLLGRAAAAMEGSGAEVTDAALATAFDMLDGRAVDLANPADRRAALALAAAVTALARGRAHVACFSDGLAARSHAAAAPMLDALGATHALIGPRDDMDARRAAYRAALVFAPARRFAQDALVDADLMGGALGPDRARIRRLGRATGAPQPVTGAGAVAAFVDDADLILLDSPAPPSLGAGGADEDGRRLAEEAFAIIAALRPPAHYEIDPITRRIRLTEEGEARAASFALAFGPPWTARSWRDETILAALAIRDLYEFGRNYTLEQGRIVLAGGAQAAPGVAPSIPDLIAAKEGLERAAPGARQIALRRWFLGYPHLGAVGVGLCNEAKEFRGFTGLAVRRRGPRLSAPPVECFADAAGKHARLAAMAADGWTLWAPTAKDAEALAGVKGAEIVTGVAIFEREGEDGRLVQAAAAPPRIEARFAAAQPEGGAVISADDDYFEPIDVPLLQRVREGDQAMTEPSYRKLQGLREAYAAEQRRRQGRADEYFDVVMAFAGDAA